jgi:hypothetical protein
MVKTTKKIEKEEKRFEFRMAFLQNFSYNCFKEANETKKPYDQCKSNTKDMLDRYLKELLDNIAK